MPIDGSSHLSPALTCKPIGFRWWQQERESGEPGVSYLENGDTDDKSNSQTPQNFVTDHSNGKHDRGPLLSLHYYHLGSSEVIQLVQIVAYIKLLGADETRAQDTRAEIS